MLYNNVEVTLFETSWEVCNKIGGIYSVVSSKTLEVTDKFGEDYYLLGPDLTYNAEFQETDEDCWKPIKAALELHNIKCRYGRWNKPGKPKVILVSFKDRYNQNQLLAELWLNYKVDSLSGGWDYIEPVLFSSLCGEVISVIYQNVLKPQKKRALAHFHEWMCGAGILKLKKLSPEVGTVFTTHATMLGRSMAGADINIYHQMGQISPVQEAAAHNITAKCSMESTSAREADCFTTVSGITAHEATLFLGRSPDVLTLNGLDLRVIPDYSTDRRTPQASRQKILEAASRLLRKNLPENTRLFIISGRYEFHNKGIDAFLEALAAVEQTTQNTSTPILALCAVMGGHMGINQNAISGDPSLKSDQGPNWISPHYVYDLPHDPIINSCNKLGLVNKECNNVNVIFIPSLLDGKDGFLNMPYEDVLAACDLGVFPSWYEPWGYTPQESAAYAVPTVTTDLSGFGLWAREVHSKRGGKSGVSVIARHQSTYNGVVADLHQILLEYASCPDEIINARRKAVRHLASMCTWEKFFPYYTKAYTLALEKSSERHKSSEAVSDRRTDTLTRIISKPSATMPTLHKLTSVAALPKSIKRLRELANNLWWVWQSDAYKLFEQINPTLWKSSDHNPVRVIEEGNTHTLQQLAEDKNYLALYQGVLKKFDTYMAKKGPSFGSHVSAERPIAYFSTEYGLHESLPIYSGGLGVLSGDHLKAASDLNIPLVGVGLLYKNGYFRQRLDNTGRQIPMYPENNFNFLPVERVLDKDGEQLFIDLELPGRKLYANIWLVKVGRIKLYLLDTDTGKNTPDDRMITARLYEADRDIRLRQEILLGMGGVRMLRRLGIWPTVYHMNEGHSAFMVLERIKRYIIEDGLTLAEAKEIVSSNTVFTTHTPVEAGNERFSNELMAQYFTGYASSVGLSFAEFLDMGQLPNSNRHVFEMTVLALKTSFKANGVSRLHSLVSKYMWRDNWPGIPTTEIPIDYITNGIHAPSYVGSAMRPLLQESMGEKCLELPPHDPAWEKVHGIDNKKLFQARLQQKATLFNEIRSWLPTFFQKYQIPRAQQAAYLENISSDRLDTLVIGFARRFAPYKRANLIFADLERLERIINNSKTPVILLFAGKAHPADEEGIKLIQTVISHCTSERFKGLIFFLEDYSLKISRLMVQGCDVWLNTPRRPYEASGTSGEKVPVNGGINLSISDGWWCEGQGHKNGWTIGPADLESLPSASQNDYSDAESLYTILEHDVVPLYYERDKENLPAKWLEYSKNSIYSLTAQFNTARMLSDYLEKAYLPAAEHYNALNIKNREETKRLANWRSELPKRFATIRFGDITISGLEGETLVCGKPLTVEINAHIGDMRPEEVLAQFVIGAEKNGNFTCKPEIITLKAHLQTDGSYKFTGTYVAKTNGRQAYAVRLMPVTENIDSVFSTKLVLWG